MAIAAVHKLDYPAIAAALGEGMSASSMRLTHLRNSCWCTLECTVRAVQERVKTHRREVRRAEAEDGSENKDAIGDPKKNAKGAPKKK